MSAGAGVGSTGKAVGPGSVSGSGGVTPMMSQSDSGSSSATTKSAISAGTINITDSGNQAQSVASVNRVTTDLNGTVSATPNVANVLSQQADMMNAAQAASQTVAQGIGDYADSKQKTAQAAADAASKAGDKQTAGEDQADANSWAEGGTNRVFLHTAGGALVAGLGGGSALGGAIGAGASAAAAGKLNQLADQIGGATGSMLAGNIASNLLAGSGGALLGGTSGGFAAANEDLYNRSTTNSDGKGGTGSEFLGQVSLYASQFGQAALNLVPGKAMADQAQKEFASGNYVSGAALAIGSVADAGLAIVTAGESSAIESVARGYSKSVGGNVANGVTDAVVSGTRGLGQYGGIFSSSTNVAGGEVWTSVADISQNDFASLVNSGLYSGEVNIINGVHGLPSGTTIVDRSLYEADAARFGNLSGVKVYNFPDLAPSQISELLKSKGTTIGGFCNSGAYLARFK